MEVAPYFRLSLQKATEIMADVRKAIGGWKQYAKRLGILRFDQEILESTFVAPVH